MAQLPLRCALCPAASGRWPWALIDDAQLRRPRGAAPGWMSFQDNVCEAGGMLFPAPAGEGVDFVTVTYVAGLLWVRVAPRCRSASDPLARLVGAVYTRRYTPAPPAPTRGELQPPLSSTQYTAHTRAGTGVHGSQHADRAPHGGHRGHHIESSVGRRRAGRGRPADAGRSACVEPDGGQPDADGYRLLGARDPPLDRRAHGR